jgi:hypothetical protein
MLHFSRPLRRRLAALMLLVLLFVQTATAAYACGTAFAAPEMPGCTEMTGMPGAMADME